MSPKKKKCMTSGAFFKNLLKFKFSLSRKQFNEVHRPRSLFLVNAVTTCGWPIQHAKKSLSYQQLIDIYIFPIYRKKMCLQASNGYQNEVLFFTNNGLYKANFSMKRTVVFAPTQRAKLQKKQCGGVCFWLYGIAYWMPIQQKLPPPVLLFSDFAGWEWCPL